MSKVQLTEANNVATLTIDRPQVLNALDSDTRLEMTAALREVQDSESLRVLVITGAGDRAFSAGQDLNEARNFEGEQAEDWVEEFDTLYEEILDLDIPVIAKLNGSAIGAAFQVALLCDFRIASDRSEVGMNEINIGIPCILGGWMIKNMAGWIAAAEITLTGKVLDADEARELNLVNDVVPDDELDEAVDDLASTLAEKPPVSMKWQKRWLRELRFEENLREVSDRGKEIHSEVYDSGEPEEYMDKFLASE